MLEDNNDQKDLFQTVNQWVDKIKSTDLNNIQGLLKIELLGYMLFTVISVITLIIMFQVGNVINHIPVYNQLSQVIFTGWLIYSLSNAERRKKLTEKIESLKLVVFGKEE